MGRLTSSISVFCVMLSCGTARLAQAAPFDRCHDEPLCRAETEQGAQLAAQHKYAEALALYERAHQRIAEPRLLIT